MKYFIALIVASAFYGELAAQTNNVDSSVLGHIPYSKKNEIGVFGESSLSNANFNESFGGVQYKRWVTPNKGLRFMAAYGNYDFYNPLPTIQKGDTLTRLDKIVNIPTTYVGVGAEIQRAFYKRVVLYAGLDLRAGFGNGWTDSLTSTNIVVADTSYPAFASSSVRTYGFRRTTVSLIPVVGAKIQFNRISFGTEIRAIEAGYIGQTVPGMKHYGIFNFDMGNFSQRLFFNYRF